MTEADTAPGISNIRLASTKADEPQIKWRQPRRRPCFRKNTPSVCLRLVDEPKTLIY